LKSNEILEVSGSLMKFLELVWSLQKSFKSVEIYFSLSKSFEGFRSLSNSSKSIKSLEVLWSIAKKGKSHRSSEVSQVNQSDDGSYRILPDPMIRQLRIGFLVTDSHWIPTVGSDDIR